MSRIAIVGAGVAGLAAARRLAEAGHTPVVLEKSKSVGGRVATRTLGDYIFDFGATSIAPRGRTIEKYLFNLLPQDGLQKIERPVWTVAYGRTSPGDPAKMKIDRYIYSAGIADFAKLMADGLDVRTSTEVKQIVPDNGYVVDGESYDALVLTCPTPQVQALLLNSKEQRHLRNVRYRTCLCVMLGYAEELPELKYHALVDSDQRSSVVWISVESAKCAGRAPEGHTAFVVQFGAQYSSTHFEDSDHEITREAISAIERVYGKPFAAPVVSQVKRWRFAQAETTATFDSANPLNSRMIVAGDGIMGARVELAFETGILAAERLIKELS